MQRLSNQPSYNVGDVWIKTNEGWKRKELDNLEIEPVTERLNPRSGVSHINTIRSHINTDRSFARNILVTGSKAQRKVSVCLSEFLKNMDFEGAVTDLRRKEYLHDVVELLVRGNLKKMSGTAHKEFFKILERMCNEALESEYHIDEVRALMELALQELKGTGRGMIGSKAVLNRHIQLVENLLTKINNHQSFQREDDDDLYLMDLPKECLREIMLKMDNHKDVINLSRTCSDLYEISQDNLMWERRTQQTFTEKQMLTFVYHTDDIDDTLPWKELYRKCYKKYGIKKTYTDCFVICSSCKTLHWMLHEHICWSSPDNIEGTYLIPVKPQELMDMISI